MAGLKVFVSSTCADLDAYRSQLRNFLVRLGHDPVMSDYSDVLYDPNLHTHASCIRDVQGADIVILLIGSRFGGVAASQTLPLIDFEQAVRSSSSVALLSEPSKISITQAEALQATISDIPIFTFVDARVYADHHLYQANKDNPALAAIKFPSIEKPQHARNIFEFINFLSHRSFNNSVITYQSFSEIESHLLKQWSLLFQRLLQERKEKVGDSRRSFDVISRIEELKSAVLQALPKGSERNVAKAVVRFRRMADFVTKLASAIKPVDLSEFNGDFLALQKDLGIEDIFWDDEMDSPYYLIATIESGGFVGCFQYTTIDLGNFSEEWNAFRLLDKDLKVAVLESAEDMADDDRAYEMRVESFNDYHQSLASPDVDGEPPIRRRRARVI